LAEGRSAQRCKKTYVAICSAAVRRGHFAAVFGRCSDVCAGCNDCRR
jgi:hypothetical protein